LVELNNPLTIFGVATAHVTKPTRHDFILAGF
jgi:hypothetical protein